MVQLNDDNFLIQCMHHYDKVSVVSIKEFEEDILRVKYIRKLFTRALQGEDVSDRLILNHIVILYNVFDDFATNILYYKLAEEHKLILTTYLYFLKRVPADSKVDEPLLERINKI